jgi:hypothetical protein
MDQNRKTELPFFARYLESQDYPSVQTDVKAGISTHKYPSDGDEHDVTLKYPSDNDENPTS